MCKNEEVTKDAKPSPVYVNAGFHLKTGAGASDDKTQNHPVTPPRKTGTPSVTLNKSVVIRSVFYLKGDFTTFQHVFI